MSDPYDIILRTRVNVRERIALRKKAMAILCVLLIIGGSIAYPDSLAANTTSIYDVTNKRQIIQTQKQQKQLEIEQVVREIEQLKAELNEVELELNEHQRDMDKTADQLDEYEAQFHELMLEIKKLDEKIVTRHEILKKRLIAYQESGGEITFLEVLFSAKSFLDFISRLTSVMTITNADRELIAQHEKELNLVAELHGEISEKMQAQEKLMQKLKKIEQTIAKETNALREKEQALKEKQAKLEQELGKLQKQDESLQQLEKSLRERALAAVKVAERMQRGQVLANATTAKKNRANRTEVVNYERVQPGQTVRMIATGYGPDCKGCTGYTYTGLYVAGDRTPRVVAVDPRVIPLGTRLWVEGYGEAVALDTGSAIKGYKIDLLFPSEEFARKYWGRRSVLVKILE